MNYLNMDPNMLLSIINMKLRDYYSNIENLCDDLDIDINQLNEKLKKAGYVYKSDINQYK
ncbi:MAG: DUF4250 domain-containing protein [Clostridiales bacterium]|nr:DUF4250 domain-containing protein [Clostridiales bacterium]